MTERKTGGIARQGTLASDKGKTGAKWRRGVVNDMRMMMLEEAVAHTEWKARSKSKR